MTANRKKILEMLSRGQITIEEADQLIAALEAKPSKSSHRNGSSSRQKPKPKNLRLIAGLYYLQGKGLGFWDLQPGDQDSPQSDDK